MTDFDTALAIVLRHEGGYTNDQGDPGGETMYGITVAEARAAGYAGAMQNLPIELARAIYRSAYWDHMRGDELGSYALGNKMLDAAVNCGVQTAVMFLQRALNYLSRAGARWPALAVDGGVGPRVLDALKAALADGHETEALLLKTINGLEAAHYVGRVEQYPHLSSFAHDWMRERVD